MTGSRGRHHDEGSQRRVPPRPTARILSFLLPNDVHGRTVLGDFHEEYQQVTRTSGRLGCLMWSWKQALVLGVTYGRPGRALPNGRSGLAGRIQHPSHVIPLGLHQ